jgi:DNA-binding transcriptional MerR regulator
LPNATASLSTPSATTKVNTASLPRAARQASGYRRYGDKDVAQLRFIRRAKALGFTLEEIRELLGLSTRRTEDMAELKQTARAKLADIDARIAELPFAVPILGLVACADKPETRPRNLTESRTEKGHLL